MNAEGKDFGDSTCVELDMSINGRYAYPRLAIEGMEAMLKE